MERSNRRKNTVLVVASDRDNISAIINSLPLDMFDFITAQSVPEALSNITYKLPNIIISEVDLPDINGFELLEKIRKGIKTRLIPFIFISESMDTSSRIHAYQTGADAFLVKPLVPGEINAILESKLRQLSEFYNLAMTDELTTLYNRREFLKKFNDEINSSAASVISLALLDLDFFKKVNDNYGHQMGDNVLMTFADVLKNSGMERSIPARFGGEEFVMLFPGIDSHAAKNIIEDIRARFFSIQFRGDKEQIFHVNFSAGIAEYPSMAGNLSHLLSRADHALYSAKREGRARTLIYNPVMARNDRFWEHLKRKREVFLDGQNREIVTGLPYLPSALETITGLDFEIMSIGVMVIKVEEILAFSAVRGMKNLHYDLQNIVRVITSSCENYFPSDTFFCLGNVYDHEFIVLFPSFVDFSLNVKKFKSLCAEIFSDIDKNIACSYYSLKFTSDVMYYNMDKSWDLFSDIRRIRDKTRSRVIKKNDYRAIMNACVKSAGRCEGHINDFSTEYFYNSFNYRKEYAFFTIKNFGDVFDIILNETKEVKTVRKLYSEIKRTQSKNINYPLLLSWDHQTDIETFVPMISEIFPGKEVIIMINEAVIDTNLADRLIAISGQNHEGIRFGLDNCYVGKGVLNLLSIVEFGALCFSPNLLRKIHLFKDRIKIINGIKVFADQVNIPVMAKGIFTEEEYTIIRDLKIFYASGPYMEQLKKSAGQII